MPRSYAFLAIVAITSLLVLVLFPVLRSFYYLSWVIGVPAFVWVWRAVGQRNPPYHPTEPKPSRRRWFVKRDESPDTRASLPIARIKPARPSKHH